MDAQRPLFLRFDNEQNTKKVTRVKVANFVIKTGVHPKVVRYIEKRLLQKELAPTTAPE